MEELVKPSLARLCGYRLQYISLML